MSRTRAFITRGGDTAIMFRVEHTLTRRLMESVLCFAFADETGSLPHLTVRQADEEIRRVLARVGGESWIYWADDVDKDDRPVLAAWAKETVSRVYGRDLDAYGTTNDAVRATVG